MPASPRGAARRRQILEATLQVIGRGGIAAVDHRTVAAEAGVPLGSTTYYFESKDDMVAQALNHVADREAERLETERQRLEGAKAAGVRRRLADQVMECVKTDRLVLLAQYQLYLEAARREDLRAAAERWDRAYRTFYHQALTTIGTPDAGGRARLLCASLDGLILQHLATGMDADELRVRAVKLVKLIAG